MTSNEWKNLSDKEKQLYKKGYINALDDCNLDWKEKENKIKVLEEQLKALENIE